MYVLYHLGFEDATNVFTSYCSLLAPYIQCPVIKLVEQIFSPHIDKWVNDTLHNAISSRSKYLI